MTTFEMECILKLVETLNFSRAARELNMTQPAFSRIISRVEHELGFKVVQRSTHSVQVSQEATAFLVSLKEAYEIYQSGLEFSRNMQRKKDSFFIACAADFVSLNLAPHVLEFRKRHPNLYVECIPATMEKISTFLRNNVADIGFIFTDRTQFSANFESRIIKRIPLHVVVNQNHPLSKKKRLEPKDMVGEKVIGLQTNAGSSEIGSYGTPLHVLNKTCGVQLKESGFAGSTQECLIRVACDQGICFFTSSLAHIVPPNCVMREIDGVEFYFTALWNVDGHSKWVREFLKQMESDRTVYD